MVRTVIDRTAFLLRDRETRAGRLTNASLYVLNAVFVGLYILSTYDFSSQTLFVIHAGEVGLAVLFLGEFLIRVYSAESSSAELLNPYTVIDLIAILPVLVAPGTGAGFLRGFHTLRVFRFLRLIIEEQQVFGQSIRIRTVRRIELSTTIFLIFFISTGFIYAFEEPVNSNIDNFGDAFYYTVIAVSTVGFGDIVPTSTAGRWVTVTAVLVGFILVPWQASRLRDPRLNKESCPRCGEAVDEPDRFCRSCGLALDEEADEFDAESEQPEDHSPPVRNE
jgi:voltage-gated potassium channel